MARKKAIDTIAKVAEQSEKLANPVSVKMIDINDLVNHPKNGEDITDTTDLENSMREQGFTEPIEVTEFGHEDGKFTIISGHRRIASAKKVKINTIPCIVRTFKNENEVMNAVLLGNTQRDSSKDPLLYVKRYAMHENYLNSINFDGDIVKEVAKRLGIKDKQCYRYRAMQKIIPDIWDMIREDITSVNNVTKMAQLDEKEQRAVLEMFKKYAEDNGHVSRNVAEKIIEGYKSGKSYDEIMSKDGKPEIAGLDYPDSSLTQTEGEQQETKDEPTRDRNDEVNREFDEFDNEDDDTSLDVDGYDFENDKNNSSDEVPTDIKNGLDLIKLCDKIDKFNELSIDFESDGYAHANTIANAVSTLVDSLYELYESDIINENDYKELYATLKNHFDTYEV